MSFVKHKSMTWYLGLISVFLVFTVSIGFTFSPASAAELTLSNMQVTPTVKAGKPYIVRLAYSADDDTEIIRACFSWSGEGPYCFPVDVRRSTIRVQLRTNNPNKYELEGFVEFKSGSKTKASNLVSKTIRVNQ